MHDKAAHVPGVEIRPNGVGVRADAGRESFRRVEEACGLPAPPPAGDGLEPLSPEEIAANRRRLDEFVDCMAAHGQDLGRPKVSRAQLAIPLPPDAFGQQFREAERECGGPPPPVPPPALP